MFSSSRTCVSSASRVLALVSLLGLGAWQPASAATATDTLVIGKPADLQTVDPGVTFDNNDWTVTYPAYQRLMRYKVEDGKGSTDVEGDLASSWTVSPDNLVWTFTLKPGNRFDDGSEVTAEAVKFSVERLMKLKQGPSSIFPADMTVTVVDPQTVRFTLQKPFAPFLFALAHDGASVINPKVASTHGKDVDAWLAGHTAGSGAYRLAAWQKGQSLTLEPNPHYAGKAPTLKQVVIRIIAEPSVRRLQLEQGDLDIIEDLPEDQVKALAQKSGFVTTAYPSLRVTYLYLNNKRAPMNDVNARKAVVDSLEYQGIVEGIAMGKAKLMNGPIPDGMWGHDPSLPLPKQDLEGAKAALGKAPKVRELQFLYSDKDPAWEPIGLTLQAGLGTLGVNLKMEKLANATFRERLGKGDFDVAIGNWSPDFADPYMFMNFWFDSTNAGLAGNRAFYSNPKVDQLLRDAASVSDVAQRKSLYQEAQKIVVGDAVYAYLYQKAYTVPMRAAVKGYVFNPMLEQVFDFAAMSK